MPTPLGIFAKEVRDDDLLEYEHRVSPTPLVIAPVRRGLWWLSARALRPPGASNDLTNVRRKVDAPHSMAVSPGREH